jgi:hypothetical protein
LNAAREAAPPEVRSQRSEDGGQKPDAGSQKPEVGGERPEVRNQKSDSSEQISEEAGEDAEVAKPEANLAPETNAAPPPPDEEGFVWPEGAEAASEAPEQSAAAPDVVNAPLPSLDELVKRIPADVRETLDDLFRVKFVSVKRTAPSSLKS